MSEVLVLIKEIPEKSDAVFNSMVYLVAPAATFAVTFNVGALALVELFAGLETKDEAGVSSIVAQLLKDVKVSITYNVEDTVSA